MFLRLLLFLGEGMFFGGGRRGVITIVPKEMVKTLKILVECKKPYVCTFTFVFGGGDVFWGREAWCDNNFS